MKEIWKDIPNYEGYYQVSDLGNVRSLDRVVENSHSGYMTLKGKLLNSWLNPDKYLCVALHKDGTKIAPRIHQLVAMAFLNHIPCGNKIEVHHINSKRIDNRLINLELIDGKKHRRKAIHKNTSSKYIGVFWNKKINRWQSVIKINKKQFNLGYFEDEYKAHLEYQKSLKIINDVGEDEAFVVVKRKYGRNYSSKYTGVGWRKDKSLWVAYTCTGGKRNHIGFFSNEYDAYLARQKELKKHSK